MKYVENDIYSGLLLSCYMDPLYHPACLCCMERNECYSEEDYQCFKIKALIMSELLDDPDCLNPENSANIARALNIDNSANIIRKILTGEHCNDGKIWSIVRLSLGLPQE